MKFLKYLVGLGVLGSVVLVNSCKKDSACNDAANPECENYDPNYGRPTADFTMRQSLKPFGFAEKPEEIAEFCDTIVASNPGVLFTAKEEGALRYEWKIGDDNRVFRTKEVALDFGDHLRSDSNNLWKPIPVQLKVVKVPDAPHDPADSVYTSERFLVFADEFLWNGTFEGYFEHEPNKKRTISYDFTNTKSYKLPKSTFADCPDSCEVIGVYLYNLHPNSPLRIEWNHTIRRGFPNFFSYKQRKWNADEGDKVASIGFMALSSGVTYFHAYAKYSSDGRHKLRLEYRHQKEQNGKETTYIFNGIKVK